MSISSILRRQSSMLISIATLSAKRRMRLTRSYQIRLADVLLDFFDNRAADDRAIRFLPDGLNVFRPGNSEADGDRRIRV